MGTVQFAGLAYRGLNNLGDHIQSIATERLLPSIVQRFNRDTLAYANPTVPLSIVMNGWFSHHPETCLPRSVNLHPVFWGFHITDTNDSWDYFSQKEVLRYLRQYEPIGCRDPYTAERLSYEQAHPVSSGYLSENLVYEMLLKGIANLGLANTEVLATILCQD